MPPDHLRLATTEPTGAAPEAARDLDAPLQPNYEVAFYALLADHRKALARLAEAEQRAGEVPGLYRQIGAMMRANNEHRRQHPTRPQSRQDAILYTHPVAALLKTLPPGLVTKQSVHNWIIGGDIDAKQIGSCWYVKDPDGLYARIEAHAKRTGKVFLRPE
jgi:hypothetical protein